MPNNVFVPPHPLSTAVLFLVFNRPDTTRQVFEAIRTAKPPRLYIAADGPREDRFGEQEKVLEVRNYVMNNIDWDCKVKTLFRDNNLGCKYAVSGAITWFFEHEEMGIILEDDCLPSQSFFWYCEDLLEKYNHNETIMHINGSSFLEAASKIYSYTFSKYAIVWGWATWKRAWDKYLPCVDDFDEEFLDIIKIFNSHKERTYWYRMFQTAYMDHIDTWDYRWLFSVWKNSGLCVTPITNMVKNIGFNKDATHTNVEQDYYKKIYLSESVSLAHPKCIELNTQNDKMIFKKVYAKHSIMIRLVKKIVNTFMQN